VKVKNVNGTSENDCNCGSWLKHWKNYSGQALPSTCREVTCMNAPDVGAHVQKDSQTDRSWYIVPLCNKHNAKATEMNIMDSSVLVSANVSHTCAKKAAWGA
jgi:hypothetical protein